MNSLSYIFRILREYGTSEGRWQNNLLSQGFARSLYLKSHLGQRNGAISFNLKEKRGNQQPKQQRYSVRFSEHADFFKFTPVLNVIWSLQSLADCWTPNQHNSRETKLLYSFNGHWKIFHVRINCQWLKNNCLSIEKENRAIKSFSQLTELSEASVTD